MNQCIATTPKSINGRYFAININSIYILNIHIIDVWLLLLKLQVLHAAGQK